MKQNVDVQNEKVSVKDLYADLCEDVPDAKRYMDVSVRLGVKCLSERSSGNDKYETIWFGCELLGYIGCIRATTLGY